MKRRRQEAKPTCEEVHDGGGQGPGDREWNGDLDYGTGELETGGTGEKVWSGIGGLEWGGRLALLDARGEGHVEVLG